VPNLDQNEADVEANIDFQSLVNANTASFTVNQTNPGIGPVTVKISAFTTAYEPGTGFVDGLGNDTPVAITSFSLTNVVVKTGNTQYFPEASIDANGDLIIKGLSTGDTVSWTTTATHNRVLIENISNNDDVAGNDNNTFDIGGFGIATPSSASTSVGQQIVIEDDGPTAALTETTAKVLHDETSGVDPNSNDQSGSAPAAFLALGAVLGWAASASAVVTPVPASAPMDREPRPCRLTSVLRTSTPASIRSTATTSCLMSRTASSSAGLTLATTAPRLATLSRSPSR
jgi:hypothetical protein